MGESEAAGLGFNPIAKAEIGIQPGEKQPVSPPVQQNAGLEIEGERLLVFQYPQTAAPCRALIKKGTCFQVPCRIQSRMVKPLKAPRRR